MEFIKLFEFDHHSSSPECNNRYVMPAMGLHFSENYDFSERYQLISWERAHGGVGLMIIGPLAHLTGREALPLSPAFSRTGQNWMGFQRLRQRSFIENATGELGAQLFIWAATHHFFSPEWPAIAPSPIKRPSHRAGSPGD